MTPARRLLTLVLLGSSAAGCVTETIPDRRPIQIIFTPPEDLDSILINPGMYHKVQLYFEINPEKDFAAIPKDRQQFYLLPTVVGAKYVYRVIGGSHQVEFFMGSFYVGKFRYPAESGGSLYVFKERSDDFYFKFHGQKFKVISTRKWKPAVMLRRDIRKDRRGNITHAHERLKIGHAVIEVSSDSRTWKLDGFEFVPGVDAIVEIQGADEFEAR